MGKVIGLDGKPIFTEDEEPVKISINAGGNIKLLGSVENNVLRNEQMLPKVPPEQVKDVRTYHKRYAVAQGVDMILKRAEEDEALKGKPIVIVVHPQQITHDKVFDQDKLTSTFEVGTLVKAEVLTDITIKIQ